MPSPVPAAIKRLKIQSGINAYELQVQHAEQAANAAKLNGKQPSYYLNYTNFTNKPTIPATNVIPATSTANKLLLSTNTSGEATWTSTTALGDTGFLKMADTGVISADGLNVSEFNLIGFSGGQYKLYNIKQGTGLIQKGTGAMNIATVAISGSYLSLSDTPKLFRYRISIGSEIHSSHFSDYGISSTSKRACWNFQWEWITSEESDRTINPIDGSYQTPGDWDGMQVFNWYWAENGNPDDVPGNSSYNWLRDYANTNIKRVCGHLIIQVWDSNNNHKQYDTVAFVDNFYLHNTYNNVWVSFVIPYMNTSSVGPLQYKSWIHLPASEDNADAGMYSAFHRLMEGWDIYHDKMAFRAWVESKVWLIE